MEIQKQKMAMEQAQKEAEYLDQETDPAMSPFILSMPEEARPMALKTLQSYGAGGRSTRRQQYMALHEITQNKEAYKTLMQPLIDHKAKLVVKAFEKMQKNPQDPTLQEEYESARADHAASSGELSKYLLERDAENRKAKKLGEPAGLDESGKTVYKSDAGLVYDDNTPYSSGKQLKPTTLSRNVGQRNPIGLDPSTKETIYQDLETMGMVHADGTPYAPKGSLLPLTQSPFADPSHRPLSPAENVRFKMQMRKEFEANPVYKDYNNVVTQLGRMEKAIEENKTSKSKVAVDQALITIYNKMMDPTSVVRESEYARTPSDQALLNNLQGRAQKILTGGAGLTNSEREALIRMARGFGSVTSEIYNNEANYYRNLATESGFSPDEIVRPKKYTYSPKQGGGTAPSGSSGPVKVWNPATKTFDVRQ